MAQAKTQAKAKAQVETEAEVPGIINREHWLAECAKRLEGVLSAHGIKVTNAYRVTCGWPAVGALSTSKRRIGECWRPEVSADGYAEIFISPTLSIEMDVAATLAHELVHAAGHYDHKRGFEKAVRLIGLEGKATATVAGDIFKALADPIIKELGSYPHGTMTPSVQRKKQSTRLLKVSCPVPDDHEEGEEYIVRMSAKTYALGYPRCGICGEEMLVEGGVESEIRKILSAPEPPTPSPELPPLTIKLKDFEPDPEIIIDYSWIRKVALLQGLTDLQVKIARERKAAKQAKQVKQVKQPRQKAAAAKPRKQAKQAKLLEVDEQEQEEQEFTMHQCAGGDGFRLCRKYNGKHICVRCWRKRVAIAGRSV